MKVSLVGAGPGDPGLLTLRGRELLASADVVVYDALANPVLLDYARKGAELVYVGKIADRHALPQEEINELLVEKARQGHHVVRLKGGDPYIFGRGGEEGEFLARCGIPFEVVPGISSAVAAPAYAGIPLTHRDFVSSVTIITGHEKPEKTVSAHNWDAYAASGSTLVFLMGMRNLPHIAANLIAAGMASDTPAAVIYRGTTPMQRIVVATLGELPEAAAAAKMLNPAVIVVGKVVKLRDCLGWFERKPLLGRTIVVTRAREQASALSGALSACGAYVLECPSISVEPMDNYEACDAAIARLSDYSWLVFTSVNGVKYFWRRLDNAGKDSRSLGNAKVAAIGPATASELAARGIRADIVPESYVAESVAAAITLCEGTELAGKRVLLPRAGKARNVLPDELAAAGAIVDIVPVYRATPAKSHVAEVEEALAKCSLDCITFGSSSTVENFLELVSPRKLLEHPETILAAIGPVTADTLRKHGLEARIMPDKFTIPGLVDAITGYFASIRKQ